MARESNYDGNSRPTGRCSRSKGVEAGGILWVPRQWNDVLDRLRAHGIPMETIQEPKGLAVEMYRLYEPKISNEPFEGHVNVNCLPVAERRFEKFPAGSVRVPVSAPFGDLVCALLEPASEDSFFSWGFFLEIIQTTEYVEAYVMEPMAEKMLREDSALAREFEDKLKADHQFRNNPKERLQWFYQRTPFYDDRAGLYPVAREIKANESRSGFDIFSNPKRFNSVFDTVAPVMQFHRAYPNALPIAYAIALAKHFEADLELGILQANVVSHTAADAEHGSSGSLFTLGNCSAGAAS